VSQYGERSPGKATFVDNLEPVRGNNSLFHRTNQNMLEEREDSVEDDQSNIEDSKVIKISREISQGALKQRY
jgi:hypothetical protein